MREFGSSGYHQQQTDSFHQQDSNNPNAGIAGAQNGSGIQR
jgi:hypothetical protein